MELGYNYKFVYSNNVVEIYHYSRPIILGKVTNSEGKNNGGTGDKENIKSTSIHRTRTKLARIINSNDWNYFLTLTYATDNIDPKDIQLFFRKMKRMYGQLKYVYVKELTKRGRLHYHILLNIDLGHIEDFREFERWFGENVWKHGFVKLKPIDQNKSIAGYLTKYLTKDLNIEGRVYNCSRGLNKPVEVCCFNEVNVWQLIANLNIEVNYVSSYNMKYEKQGEEVNNKVEYIKGEIIK